MADEIKLLRWPKDKRFPKCTELESILKQEGYEPFRMVDPPCTYYHTLAGKTREIRWVVEGQILIGLADREIVLERGDRLDLPAGMKRYMRILSEEGAIYLLASG